MVHQTAHNQFCVKISHKNAHTINVKSHVQHHRHINRLVANMQDLFHQMAYPVNLDLDTARNTNKNLPTAASCLFLALQRHDIADMLYSQTIRFPLTEILLCLLARTIQHLATSRAIDPEELEQRHILDNVPKELVHPNNVDERKPNHEVDRLFFLLQDLYPPNNRSLLGEIALHFFLQIL